MHGKEFAQCAVLLSAGLRLFLAVGQTTTILPTTGNSSDLLEVHSVEGRMGFEVSDERTLEEQEAVARAALKQGIAFFAGINTTDLSAISTTVDVLEATMTYSIRVGSFARARILATAMTDPSTDQLQSYRRVVNQQLALNEAGFQIWGFENMEVRAQTVTVEVEDTSCPVTCCDERVRLETRLFCTEFQDWDTDDALCSVWESVAHQSCLRSCGDCSEIGRAIYDQCLFYMAALQGPRRMSYIEAQILCRGAVPSFERQRCNSLCNATFDVCNTNASTDCSFLCGNYQGCDVFMLRDAPGMPNVINGETVLIGPVEGRIGLQHSCQLMPEECMNHRPSSCGRYKHCPVDLCAVYEVSCPPLDACRPYGECSPADGLCYYTALSDGSACDDGIFYTLDTTCMSGVCLGFADLCLRDGVTCETFNPCLVSPGTCHAASGSCFFEVAPEGTDCNSSTSDGPVPGECGFGDKAGLCLRMRPDMCQDADCPSLGQCYGQAVCDEDTGVCTADLLIEGVPCNDSNAFTSNDRCLGGVCVGESAEEVEYKDLGRGVCGQNGTRMPSYFGDVGNVEECRRQCTRDPLCAAFSFKFPNCNIHTLPRLRGPEGSHWNRTWSFFNWDWASMPVPGLEISALELRPGELPYVCYIRGSSSVVESLRELLKMVGFYAVLSFVLLVPAIGFLEFVGFLRCVCLRRCCSRVRGRCARRVHGRLPEKPWMEGRPPLPRRSLRGSLHLPRRRQSVDEGEAAASETAAPSPTGKSTVAAFPLSPNGSAQETEDEETDVQGRNGDSPEAGPAPFALSPREGVADVAVESTPDPRGAVADD